MKTRYDTSTGAGLPRLEVELDLREAHSLGTALLCHSGPEAGEDPSPTERRLRGIAGRALRVRLQLSMLDISAIHSALDRVRRGAPETRSELIADAVATRLREAYDLAHEHRGHTQNLPRGFREAETEPERNETQGET